MNRTLLLLIVCCWCASCECPNVFRSVPPNRVHAVLTSDNPPGFRGFFGLGREVSPWTINGQPTPFWRMRDPFRILPGPTVLHVIDTSEPYGYEPLRFLARAGCHYTLRPTRTHDRDAVTISERSADTTREQVVGSALRDRD
jgi:hypothetical protein